MAKEETKNMVNCLRAERIIVRHVPKIGNKIQNPKHVLYGGMAENAIRVFVVPRLSSGKFVNVLTNSEKEYLEHIMGLEPNALSIHKRDHNFWSDANPEGVSKVILKKQDTFLDLSDPSDYIRYKILLANKDYICPSLETLENRPKATYQYVLIGEGDEHKQARSNTTNLMEAFKEFGKIEDNRDYLKLIIETIDGRPIAATSKMEFLQAKVSELIQVDPKKFLKVIRDSMFPTKVLIDRGVQAGVITRRGDWLYLRSDGKPLCEDNQEPNINTAAAYLNNPKHQSIKFAIEAELKGE